MLQTPPHIASRFDAALAAAGVDEHHQPHFRRWLRFYLDFCHKYGKDPANAVSLDAFEEKLKGKGQAPWMRRQACEAVALFLSLRGEGVARRPAVATQVPSEFVNGAGPPPVVPGPDFAARSNAQARAKTPLMAPGVPSATGQAGPRRHEAAMGVRTVQPRPGSAPQSACAARVDQPGQRIPQEAVKRLALFAHRVGTDLTRRVRLRRRSRIRMRCRRRARSAENAHRGLPR